MENKNNKLYTAIFAILLIISMIIYLTSCAKAVYVPVESTRIEYQEKISRDSIYRLDSVLVKIKGDSVWFEKYTYIYRDKIIRDSIFKTDSIRVPYPVDVVKEVNKLSGWQNFQVWLGRISLGIIVILGLILFIRWKFKLF